MDQNRIELDHVDLNNVNTIRYRDLQGNSKHIISYNDGLPSYQLKNGAVFVRELHSICRPSESCFVEYRYLTQLHLIEEDSLNVVSTPWFMDLEV